MIAWNHPIWRWWDRFWFSPGLAKNLAAARIIFGLHALWILLSRDLPALSNLPLDFWAGVPSSLRWRYLMFPGNSSLEYALQALTITALVATVLGLYPRVSCLLAGLLLYHLAPLETFIWTAGPYERGFEIDVLAMVTLAFAPCTDGWSLSARKRTPTPPRLSYEYGWPLRLVQLFVAQIYFFSGYSKLHRVGWEWVSAGNLRRWLLVFSQQDQLARFHTLGPWAADRPMLCLAIAVSAIALDLGFIVALFWGRARPLILLIALSFHLGIFFAMNIAFLNLPQLLIFVDWDHWVGALRGQRNRRWPLVEPRPAAEPIG